MDAASIWDEPDGAIEALNLADEPRRRREAHAKATRRRGGMAAWAEQASLSAFDMPLRELDREPAKTLPPRRVLEAALEAVRTVAGYAPDHAAIENGLGFARSDVALGHALASAPLSSAIDSPGMALLVWRMAMRYRRQVPARLNLISGFTDQLDLLDG